MNWLNDELKLKIRKVYEPKYGRNLSDFEVEELATNLTDVLETCFKAEYRDHSTNSSKKVYTKDTS